MTCAGVFLGRPLVVGMCPFSRDTYLKYLNSELFVSLGNPADHTSFCYSLVSRDLGYGPNFL